MTRRRTGRFESPWFRGQLRLVGLKSTAKARKTHALFDGAL